MGLLHAVEASSDDVGEPPWLRAVARNRPDRQNRRQLPLSAHQTRCPCRRQQRAYRLERRDVGHCWYHGVLEARPDVHVQIAIVGW